MNIFSPILKTSSAILLFFLSVASVQADEAASRFYKSVEQHLRSLQSLEIGYVATGSEIPEALEGRLVFLRPDGFFHDTPEWTHCEFRGQQWRFLKNQNTLILEDAEGRSEWTPETVLLNMSHDLTPEELVEESDGTKELKLWAESPLASGQVSMTFAPGSLTPGGIHYVDDNGTTQKYSIRMWNESVKLDTAIFTPPAVPDDNRIDFRGEGDSHR
jgi:outer membrane lipoprotein-sorting protein